MTSCLNCQSKFLSKYPENNFIKWYNDKEDIAPIRAHLIDSIQNTKIFSSIDFLIVVQALEGFCTRFRTEANLTKMLEAIISEFSDIDKLKDDNIKTNKL